MMMMLQKMMLMMMMNMMIMMMMMMVILEVMILISVIPQGEEGVDCGGTCTGPTCKCCVDDVHGCAVLIMFMYILF